jgi:hypothetical protein
MLMFKIWEINDKKWPKSRAYLGELWAHFLKKNCAQVIWTMCLRKKCAQRQKNAPKDEKMRPNGESSPQSGYAPHCYTYIH